MYSIYFIIRTGANARDSVCDNGSEHLYYCNLFISIQKQKIVTPSHKKKVSVRLKSYKEY